MYKRLSNYIFAGCMLGLSYVVSFANENIAKTSLGINIYHPTKSLFLINLLKKQTAPLNELGFDQDEAYVSDIKNDWSYSSLHYYHFTRTGTFGARINHANRYGIGGEQYQLEAYPTLFSGLLPGSYANLTFAVSNTSQRVYPLYQYSIEPYFTLPHGYETSLGQRYLKSFDVNIYSYTGSIGKYIGNYFIWFRPYHYTPKSTNYFEFGVRHDFNMPNTYVAIKTGMGKSPDIGDIPPFNQIIILSTNAVNIDGEMPVYKSISLKSSIGYIRQVYHSGKIREITDASLGMIWQF